MTYDYESMTVRVSGQHADVKRRGTYSRHRTQCILKGHCRLAPSSPTTKNIQAATCQYATRAYGYGEEGRGWWREKEAGGADDIDSNLGMDGAAAMLMAMDKQGGSSRSA